MAAESAGVKSNLLRSRFADHFMRWRTRVLARERLGSARMRSSRQYLFLPGVLALALSLGGCAILKKIHLPGHRHAPKTLATSPPALPQFVGTITLVNETDHFVLIDVGQSSVPREGTALKAMADGVETGVVTVGDVRRRPFAIADIVRGEPKNGNQVFQ